MYKISTVDILPYILIYIEKKVIIKYPFIFNKNFKTVIFSLLNHPPPPFHKFKDIKLYRQQTTLKHTNTNAKKYMQSVLQNSDMQIKGCVNSLIHSFISPFFIIYHHTKQSLYGYFSLVKIVRYHFVNNDEGKFIIYNNIKKYPKFIII